MIVETVLAKYPVVQEHLAPYLVQDGRRRHPITRRLAAGQDLRSFLVRFDELLKRGSAARGFTRLSRKLGTAKDESAFFDYFTELEVCVRFIDMGNVDIDVACEDGLRKQPDMVVAVDGLAIHVEVTRLHAIMPRQQAYISRLNRLCHEMCSIESPFYVTFFPEAEYDDTQVSDIASVIRRQLNVYLVSESVTPTTTLNLNSDRPPFSMSTSLKGGYCYNHSGTAFKVGTDLVFPSEDGREARKLLDAVGKKYSKFDPGMLNVLVIHLPSDVLEEAAQVVGSMFDSERPNLSGVVLLSDWGSGRSRILPNPQAQPLLPGPMLAVLEELVNREPWEL